ncbi:MAG TPA: hypothetical protein PK244_06405 [Pseudomonadales bacterium]|nr:hypothetical protein [Pseudomonadales bacterium]
MSRREDDIFDNATIIPDTEDRLTRATPPKPATPARRTEKKNTPATSHGKSVLVLLAFAVMLIIAGFLHYRITQQIDANNKLQARTEALESQLGISISDSKKSGDTMEDKIKKLDARLSAVSDDIAKLNSAINDKTKKTLDAHDKSLASLQTNISDIKKLVAQIEKLGSDGKQSAERANTAVTEVNNALSALQQRVAQGDPAARDAGRQATMALEQNDQLQKKLDALNKRTADQEETLRSIDSFRRSVNSDLNKLKQDRAQSNAIPMQ